MNTTIKETVKNIFKANAFEAALDLTRNLRGEYTNEYGVKSWNALVTYYKKANIPPEVAVVDEPETSYQETTAEEPKEINAKASKKELKKELKKEFEKKIAEIYEGLKDETGGVSLGDLLEAYIALQDEYLAKYGVMLGDKNWKRALGFYREGESNKDKRNQDEEPEILVATISPENVGDLHNTLAGIFGEDPVTAEPTNVVVEKVEEPAEESSDEVEAQEEEERVEYMLYQNDDEKVDWYGHFVNYKGLKVGESGMMVRMNNLGVGMGKVLATASMTMKEIGMYHKCYATIRQSVASDNRRVVLFKRSFNNLQNAMKDPKFATLTTGKAIADFVLNYTNED